MHEDCVLACSVASGSEFGLTADVEEKIEKSSLLQKRIYVNISQHSYDRGYYSRAESVFMNIKVAVEEACI